MEMRANQDIEIGEDITPPLLPLSFSLHDSFLSSHCSSCFSPSPLPYHAPLYCSAACSAAHSPIHSSSAESLLPVSPHSSDLRTALRLLLSLPSVSPHLHRFNNGLLTNYHYLTSSPEFSARIRQGAIAMAAARKLLNGDSIVDQSDDVSLEEAALSLVVTNAVEVLDESGRALGIAVYDPSFSWINHSCSPNACYRFSVSPPSATSSGEDSSSTLRIVPSVSDTNCGACTSSDYLKGTKGYKYGPKIIVRSIKRIQKGEEVCISYTDLLQPKAMRQSDLWFKYQFTCSCSRCTASPSTYVDRVLEEILASNLTFSSSPFDLDLYREEANKRLSDYVDETITEFLSVGDPESCCKKLESMLNQGLHIKQSESKNAKSKLNIKVHPFHHSALNAYTTLTSVYRIRSSDFLALRSETDESQLKAFDMSRISAAYSLLLAGATHHLFCLEPSLIVSVANFWKHAGESLLTLAKSSICDSSGSPIPELSTTVRYKCPNCSLMDIFGAELILSQADKANFENISSNFFACMSNMTPKIWRFLIHGCRYLETFEEPFHFRWLADGNRNEEGAEHVTEDSNSEHHAEWYINDKRIQIYKVGIHCLMYGAILAYIYFGRNSHLTTDVLNHADKFAH